MLLIKGFAIKWVKNVSLCVQYGTPRENVIVSLSFLLKVRHSSISIGFIYR